MSTKNDRRESMTVLIRKRTNVMDVYFMVCLMKDEERKSHRMRNRLRVCSGCSCRQKKTEKRGNEGRFEHLIVQ